MSQFRIKNFSKAKTPRHPPPHSGPVRLRCRWRRPHGLAAAGWTDRGYNLGALVFFVESLIWERCRRQCTRAICSALSRGCLYCNGLLQQLLRHQLAR